MRKITLHIVSLVVCLGIFVNTSAMVLSSLPLELKLELTEETTDSKEVELSQSILQDQEGLVFPEVYNYINTLASENLNDNRIPNSLSKGTPYKLHLIYESYLI